MFKKLLPVIAVALIATPALTYFYRSSYPFVLASDEARKSVEVTDEQLSELKAATRSSDNIAYAILGACLCGFMPVAMSNAMPAQKNILRVILGVLLGAFVGYGGGCLGHWFDSMPSLQIEDLMMHVVLRSLLMLAPLAILCGLLAGFGHQSGNAIGGAVVGSILGLVGCVALFAILSGTVTEAEQRHKLFPSLDSNRLLLIAGLFLLLGFGIVTQLRTVGRPNERVDGNQPSVPS